MMYLFPIMPGVTTRQITAKFRSATAAALAEHWPLVEYHGIVADEDRRRSRPYVSPGVRSDEIETRYVFGIHSPVRSTLVGHYIVGSGEFGVVMPNDYAGWDSASGYDRLRVRIYDLIVHNGPHIRDTSQPSRTY